MGPAKRTDFGRCLRASGPRVLAALLLACTAPAAAWAGFRTFTTSDGLAGDGVRVMLEDASGTLWFGTSSSGLGRYDGVNWTTIGTAAGLPDASVFDLVESPAGELWVATGAGVARIRDGSITAYGPADGLPAAAFFQLAVDGAALWVRSDGEGVARFDGAGWTRHTAVNGLASNVTNDMLVDAGGRIWVATSQGLSRFESGLWITFGSADGLPGNTITALLETGSGEIWCASPDGVGRFDGAWRRFTTADGLASNIALSLAEDRDGNVWVGTAAGASRFDGASWTTFTSADGLAGDRIEKMFVDASGRLWLGAESLDVGISRFDGAGFDRFTTADGLAANHVTDFLQDRAGGIWLATGFPGAGVSRFDGVHWRTFREVEGLANNRVLDLAGDTTDAMWIGTANGLSRFDGMNWALFTSFEGLPGDSARAVLVDRTGLLWAGTNAGLATYDGATWNPIPAVSGVVNDLFEDAAGGIWAATRAQGVARFAGGAWTYFTSGSGLADNEVRSVTQDASGAMWFGTADGVSRFAGGAWSTFRTADGLPGNLVHTVHADAGGLLWAGTEEGLGRWDGVSWTSFTENDGLASRAVRSIHETADGVLWFGTAAGVTRYDGGRFTSFGQAQGLAAPLVLAVSSDSLGRLWFGTNFGLSRFEPDRIPPRAVITVSPPAVTGARNVTITYEAAYGETGDITFSHVFDGGAPSPWSSIGQFVRLGVVDGIHTFDLVARDRFDNVQAAPTRVGFEIDGTPPAPQLSAPHFGEAVSGVAGVIGTVDDPRFSGYAVQVRPAGATSWDSTSAATLAQSAAPVIADTLATWDTAGFPDGDYELRVIVADTLGLAGIAQSAVIVDNVFPFADQTSPVRIVAGAGGSVFTTGAQVRLFFPPNAFAQDAIVSVNPAAAPESLGAGTWRVTPAHAVGWAGGTLGKSATLEIAAGAGAYGALPVPAGAGAVPAGTPLAVYAAGADSVWRRVGGTFAAGDSTLRLSFDAPGRFAVFVEAAAAPPGARMLSALSLTPRAFSPRGNFSDTRIAIGFTLGRAAPVTVKVYNRAGRLVREVASGLALGAGANLVYWDGRDRDGDMAREGLYVVTVEALDEKQTQTLAVVE